MTDRGASYVRLQQALDQAAQQMAQATAAAAAQQQGPPPASTSALKRIPIVRVAADDLTKDNECCTICLEDHVPGELAARLPCGHLFHKDCVVEWLRRHCVCPVCRYELPTDSVVYERTRREHNREGGRRVRVRKRELDAMNIRALLDVLKAAGESARGCVERDDLIRRVLTSSRVDVVAETTVEVSRSELDAMSLGAVARLAKRAGVVIDGALERPDVVALLEESGRVLIESDDRGRGWRPPQRGPGGGRRPRRTRTRGRLDVPRTPICRQPRRRAARRRRRHRILHQKVPLSAAVCIRCSCGMPGDDSAAGRSPVAAVRRPHRDREVAEVGARLG